MNADHDVWFFLDEDVVRAGRRRCRVCTLCGESSSYTGAFAPSPEFAEQINSRLVFYGLCESCWHLPDREERVERQTLLELGTPATTRLQ